MEEGLAAPFPALEDPCGDHGDGLVKLQISAMEFSLSVVVGTERWRGRGMERRLEGEEIARVDGEQPVDIKKRRGARCDAHRMEP